ncbi:MAG: methyl-accepting chemotaxis protein [Burkholderiales bacterium]
MSLKQKIWSLPILAILIFMGGMVTNYVFSSSTSRLLSDVSTVDYPLLASSQALIFDLNSVQESLTNATTAGDKQGLEKAAQKANAFRKDLAALKAVAGQSDLADKIGRGFETYYGAAEQAAAIMLNARAGDLSAVAATMRPALEALIATLETTKKQAVIGLESNLATSRTYVNKGLVVNLGIAIAIVLVLIAVSHLVISSVFGQLGGEPSYAASIVRNVAAGDLSTQIIVKPGDAGSLLFAMRTMQQRFSAIVSEIRESVTSVATSAKEIASGNMNLSQRTEEQASSLEQTATSLGELTSTVKKNADSATQARTLATEASRLATDGGDAVGGVIQIMSSINDSSRKIVEIIGVIDSIAFQTNILALNAAVEAARAGEQGYGFAVVAAEVRNLAQRSGSAAKEIKELINASVEKVSSGSERVRVAGETMNEIVASVKRVTGIVGEIAVASSEQSLGIGQVNTALDQLNAVTQQNAALVEEAAAATESLEELARSLANSVSVFRLAEDATEAANSPHPATRIFPVPEQPEQPEQAGLMAAGLAYNGR